MKLVKIGIIALCIFSMVNLSSADITVHFTNAGGVNNTDVDSAGAANETPFTDEDGFVIGAYFAGTGVGANNDITMSNSTSIIKLRNSPGAGSYIYTIYPQNAMLVDTDIDPIGLETRFPEGANETYQYMFRDASTSNWFIADEVNTVTGEGNGPESIMDDGDPTTGTFTSLDTASNTLLNALTGGDEDALTTVTAAIDYATAFPTDRIDGVGLFLANGLGDLMQIDYITIKAQPFNPPAPEGLRTGVNTDWSIYK